jgi:hypothetical protein
MFCSGLGMGRELPFERASKQSDLDLPRDCRAVRILAFLKPFARLAKRGKSHRRKRIPHLGAWRCEPAAYAA